jgi:hypothetical protein
VATRVLQLKLKKMPDITMCKGEGCEIKSTCYRFTAKPSEFMQSYFAETPNINGGCEYYYKQNTTPTG